MSILINTNIVQLMEVTREHRTPGKGEESDEDRINFINGLKSIIGDEKISFDVPVRIMDVNNFVSLYSTDIWFKDEDLYSSVSRAYKRNSGVDQFFKEDKNEINISTSPEVPISVLFDLSREAIKSTKTTK